MHLNINEDRVIRQLYMNEADLRISFKYTLMRASIMIVSIVAFIAIMASTYMIYGDWFADTNFPWFVPGLFLAFAVSFGPGFWLYWLVVQKVKQEYDRIYEELDKEWEVK